MESLCKPSVMAPCLFGVGRGERGGDRGWGVKHDCVYSYNTTVLVDFILRGCLSFCLSNNLYLSGWPYSMFLVMFRLGNLWFCSLHAKCIACICIHGLQRRDDCIISYTLTFPSLTTVGCYFPFPAKYLEIHNTDWKHLGFFLVEVKYTVTTLSGII